MKTKNQRIALMLEFISKNFAGIANQMEAIKEILLEKESSPADGNNCMWDQETRQFVPMNMNEEPAITDYISSGWQPTKAPFSKSPLSPKPVGSSTTTTSWSEPHTTPTTSKSTDNKVMSEATRRSCVTGSCEVTRRIEELNALAKDYKIDESSVGLFVQKALAVAPDKKKDPIRLPSCWQGISLAVVAPHLSLRCIRENCNSLYYKILTGADKGAVLRFSKKTKLCTLDGAFDVNHFNHSSSHIGCVSCDQDGRDYVNNVIRKALNTVPDERVKIVRMYRPKGHAGKFTHCDLYLKA